MMLALPTARRTTACVMALAFFVTNAALDMDGAALAQGIGATGKQRVLVVPIQRAEDVSSVVPGRVGEYIQTLLNMSGKVEVVGMSDLVDKPAKPVIRPIETDKLIVQADEALWKAKDAAQKGSYGKAIKLFKRATKLYEKRFDKLVDFDKYIDAALGVSLAYFLAGYEDNGEDALAPLLVLRPNLILDKRKVPKTAIDALERLTRMYSGGTPGKVTIKSTPPGAEVFVDGNRVGVTPHTVSGLYRGKHVARLVMPGYQPTAKAFTAGARNQTIRGRLKTVAKAKNRKSKKQPVDTPALVSAVEKGTLHRSVDRTIRPIAERFNLDAVVHFYIRKTPTQFELAPFIYDKRANRVAELEWIHLDHGLTTMQVNLLVLDEKLHAALANFPKSRTMRRKSKIYEVIKPPKPKAKPKSTLAPLVLVPKTTPKAPSVSVPSMPVVSAPKPSPKVRPKARPKPKPKARPAPRRKAAAKRAPKPRPRPKTNRRLAARHPAPAATTSSVLVVQVDDGLGGNLGSYPYPGSPAPSRSARDAWSGPAVPAPASTSASSYGSPSTSAPSSEYEPLVDRLQQERAQVVETPEVEPPPAIVSPRVPMENPAPVNEPNEMLARPYVDLDAADEVGNGNLWYEEWWVWTLVGAAVAGGTTAAVLLIPGGGDDARPGFGGTVQW